MLQLWRICAGWKSKNMEKYEYPLLYYPRGENAVLGLLIGAGLEVMEAGLEGVKAVLTDYLQKAYKKNGHFPGWRLENATLKAVDVTLRPAFSDGVMMYPMVEPLDVRVYAITGTREDNSVECFLPWLNEHFVCFDPAQLDTLLHHTATSALRRMTPEQIFRIRAYGKPGLARIALRVNTGKERGWGSFGFRRSFPVLEQLCEQMPMRRSKTLRTAPLPETAWEMEDIVADVARRIAETNANVLVAGNPGSGKSTVLLSAVRHITRRQKGEERKLTFWRIMSQRIVVGAQYLGEWQQSCEELIDELHSAQGVLWVADAAQLLLTGGSSPEDSVAAFLQPFLQQGRVQIIGEVTPQELHSMRRLLPGFAECFQVVQVPELSDEKVQSVLGKYAAVTLQQQKIAIEPEALRLAYRILSRYYPYEQFPGKGVRFLSRCVGEAVISGSSVITPADIIQNFVVQTGFPEVFLRDDMPIDPEALRGFFRQRIKGQDQAIDRLCQVVKVFKTGLNNPHKPISVLLFTGPTGVGKTAAAKSLADYFFGKGRAQTPLVRLDMSEFQSAWQLGRLIGEGREPGQLVREIRERPFSVLLLDEIEKADDAVFDMLLNTLDEGTLTDSFGRVTNFRNCIIIMTSNLGTGGMPSLGFRGSHNLADNAWAAVKKRFRPEFVNRIDDIIVFEPLTKEHLHAIARRELELFSQRDGFLSRGLRLQFTERLIAYLTEVGFDPVYGARPLQRALEREVAGPVAVWLLSRPQLKDVRLVVDYEEELEISISGN